MSNILPVYISFWRTHQWNTYNICTRLTISYQSRPFHKCIKYEHHMQSGVNIPWVECSNVVVKRSVSSLVVWSNTSIIVWSVVLNKTTTALSLINSISERNKHTFFLRCKTFSNFIPNDYIMNIKAKTSRWSQTGNIKFILKWQNYYL